MGKSSAKSDPSYEARLSLAIDAFKNQKLEKLRHAARLYDVSEATLRRRLKGTKSPREAGIPRRKLTPTEEIVLRDWIYSLERRGVPPRPRMLGEMANILLAERDLTKAPKEIGVNWVTSFMNRYPDLKIKFSRQLTYSRALCEDPAIIGGFFTNLTQLKPSSSLSTGLQTRIFTTSMKPDLL